MEDRFMQPLKAETSVLLLIDYQPQMLLGVESHDRTRIRDNVVAFAGGARAVGVPAVLTAINEKGFGGRYFPEIREIFPDAPFIDRTTVPGFDVFDDPRVVDAVGKTGHPQLVLSGLWTSMCFALSALHGLREGYAVYGVLDTAGSESPAAHDAAVQRMVQAGVVPATWMQVVCEWMHDWADPSADDVRNVLARSSAFFDKASAYYASVTKDSK